MNGSQTNATTILKNSSIKYFFLKVKDLVNAKDIVKNFSSLLENELLKEIQKNHKEMEKVINSSKDKENTTNYILCEMCLKICQKLKKQFEKEMDEEDLENITKFEESLRNDRV